MQIDKNKINTLSKGFSDKVDSLQLIADYKIAKNAEATAFLLKNINHIKFILCTHKIKNRYNSVINYMDNNFESYDIKVVNKILFRNGIFKESILTFFEVSCIVLISFLIIIFLIAIQIPFLVFIFIFIFILIPAFGILCDYISDISDSKFVNYRLSKKYRNLPILSKKIPLE